MLANYFKTAWRNLIRNKGFSAINILGLALGLACSLVIFLWIRDERSMDAFHANGKQLYQVYERNFFDGKEEASYFTQGLLADELKRVIPEIEFSSSLDWNRFYTFEAGEKIDKMEGSYAGADFFSMFSYPLLQGTPASALNAPNSIAISRKMAAHFFGSPEQAIGKAIRFENKEDLTISAVFENIPVNSSYKFEFLRSWKAFIIQNPWVNSWGNADPSTLVQLRADADPVKVEAKIKDFIHRYDAKALGPRIELALQPYSEKYLHSTFKHGRIAGGRIEYVRLFTGVAIFILLIACINFMNLATARSAKRAKEVGIRKVVGALRSALMGQFVGEALLLTFLSIILAVIITAVLLPAFNVLTAKQLFLPFGEPAFWLVLLGLLLITGFVAGSYPALFLSSLKPIRVLKGTLNFSKGATYFRKGLVVFQFGLSIILIIGMIVIYRQMDYIQSKNLGYDRENLVYIPIDGTLIEKYTLFKEEAGKLPGIVAISKMKESPTAIGHHTTSIEWKGKDPNVVASTANAIVGYDFVETMHLQLKEGRDFSKSFGTDSAGFLINESAARKFGYQAPLGQPLKWGRVNGTIIGVLKDFHFNSMHSAIEPLVIRLNENQPWGTILVRTEAGRTKAALTGLEKICRELNPSFPFTYQFSDMEYTKLYKSEQAVSQLSNYFAFLAIFISCLGLFGLAMFTAGQRTKEIGVRKVLGASVGNIVLMLSANFLKPVTVGILVAIPIAWFTMHNWLQNFAYKVDIEWWIFVTAGLLTICIAMLTVSFQSIRAALANPVKSLKSE